MVPLHLPLALALLPHPASVLIQERSLRRITVPQLVASEKATPIQKQAYRKVSSDEKDELRELYKSQKARLVASEKATPIKKQAYRKVSSDEKDALRELYKSQKAKASVKIQESERVTMVMDAVVAWWVNWWQPRLRPHDIPIITLSPEQWLSSGADALDQLLDHRACAVHVKGWFGSDDCISLQSALNDGGLFSNWEINRLASSGTASEVDKVGIVSGEAMDSFEDFCEYLISPSLLEQQLEPGLNPFERLLAELDQLHPEGCKRDHVGRWEMPAGTFRRMTKSMGLVHADTSALLSRKTGEFSANIYVETPPGKGALHIYPAQQYSTWELPSLYALMQKQQAAYGSEAQNYIRSALPLKRTIDVSDGDLVLINTGRFHEVDRYDEGYRLSGQGWLSYKRGYPLYLWV